MAELTFTVVDDSFGDDGHHQCGLFSRDWTEEEELNAIQEMFQSGTLSSDTAIDLAVELLKKHPGNLEINNFLAARYFDEDLQIEAADIYEAAYMRAISLVPKEFSGRIHWQDRDNQSFLRIALGHLQSLLHFGHARRAQALANKLLRWCPSDNLGIRFLIGDIKFLLGDMQSALQHYVKQAENSPVSWYGAALITFRAGDYVDACTYLRKGIAGNPYVAEALTGRTLLANHLYWHGSNIYDCRFALEYLQSAGNDWTDAESDFVDWVFNSAAVLRERASFMEIHEALTVEHDPMRRGPWANKSCAFVESIDDQISKLIVRKVVSRWGDQIWPWDRAGHARPTTRG